MKVRANRLLAALAVAAVTGSAGCGAASNSSGSEDERSFPFTADRLTIDNHGGDLRIVAGSTDSVDVVRTLNGSASRSGNATWSLDDGTLRLEVVCSGLVINCGGLHVVAVPAGTALEVNSDSPVRAVGLSGHLTARVVDEWLRVEDHIGELELTAGANVDVVNASATEIDATSRERNVVLAFVDPPRRVDARAHEGSVTVTVPDGDETYRVEAATAGGPATTTVPDDPGSDRTITVTGYRGVDVRRGS